MAMLNNQRVPRLIHGDITQNKWRSSATHPFSVNDILIWGVFVVSQVCLLKGITYWLLCIHDIIIEIIAIYPNCSKWIWLYSKIFKVSYIQHHAQSYIHIFHILYQIYKRYILYLDSPSNQKKCILPNLLTHFHSRDVS